MYYNDMKVDIALIETGIGGKFDSTNVLTPLISVLTSISLDHTQILGDTVEAIAEEKAGIIKHLVPVISAVKDKQAVAVIEKKAELEQAPIYQLYKDFLIENVTQEINQQCFSYELNNEKLNDLSLKMMGHHQVENASLAVTAALLLNKYHGFTISEESIRQGLNISSWAARFEEVMPNVIIDGAHNPAGMEVLIKTIQQRYETKNIHVVFTALQDKDISSVLHMLDEIAASITKTDSGMPLTVIVVLADTRASSSMSTMSLAIFWAPTSQAASHKHSTATKPPLAFTRADGIIFRWVILRSLQ
jgi:dihydrofolate synthase/folylpolyglutamate synthase